MMLFGQEPNANVDGAPIVNGVTVVVKAAEMAVKLRRLGESVAFFLYDVPKILLLLGGMIFAITLIRSFFSPEQTRALLGDVAQPGPALEQGEQQIVADKAQDQHPGADAGISRQRPRERQHQQRHERYPA